MNTILDKSQISVTPEILALAVAIPDGHFVEVTDLMCEMYDLGPKIAKTTQVELSGRRVSLMYYDAESTVVWQPLVSTDGPTDLGCFGDIMSAEPALSSAIAAAMHWQPIEMVAAIRACVRAGISPTDPDAVAAAALEAKQMVRRQAYLHNNPTLAFIQSPAWDALGM